MKRLIACFATFVVALGTVFAQDLAAVTEMYNAGAEAYAADNKESALKAFEDVLPLALALGEEGKDIAEKCKTFIPSIKVSLAKGLAKEAKFDEAIAILQEAKKLAAEYEDFSVEDEAGKLIPQLMISKGDALRTNKQYDEASAVYQEVLVNDPNNGAVALRLGVALKGAGKLNEAKEAFEKAAANGQASANQQLGTIYLTEATAALNAKKDAEAIAAAVKAGEYMETDGRVWRIAGTAAQRSGKNNDAIKFFEKFLEVAPNDTNAGAIAYTVGALYQGAKNNAKAKEYYAKAVNDPKYGAEAKKLLDALK